MASQKGRPPDHPRLIEGIDQRGRGLASCSGDEGITRMLVPGALPGDLVNPIAMTPTHDGVRVLEWTMCEPSADRIESPCPAAATCGGCALMGLTTDAQRHHRVERLRRAMDANGLDAHRLLELTWAAGAAPLEYRNRVRLKVDMGQVRFFNQRKVSTCPVLEPAVRETMCQLRLLKSELLKSFTHLEVRGLDAVGRASVLLHRGSNLETSTVLRQAKRISTELRDSDVRPRVAVNGYDTPLPAPRYEMIRVPRRSGASREEPLYSRVPLSAFLQVNHQVNGQLVAHIRDGAMLRSVESCADLYCGAGNLSLPLLAEGVRCLCNDERGESIRALGRSVREQGIDSDAVRLTVGDAATRARALAEKGRRFDLLILNPPRTGLRGDVRPLSRLARHHILLCSCEPTSLARDLAALRAENFEIQSFTLFDMFPQTHHVEVLVWLTRAG